MKLTFRHQQKAKKLCFSYIGNNSNATVMRQLLRLEPNTNGLLWACLRGSNARQPCPFYLWDLSSSLIYPAAPEILPANKRFSLDTLHSTFDSISFRQLNGLPLQYSRSPSDVAGVQKWNEYTYTGAKQTGRFHGPDAERPGGRWVTSRTLRSQFGAPSE